MKATTVKLSTATLKQTADTIKGDIETGHKWVKLADLYRAEGVTASMLETENKGGDERLRDQVKEAIVAGFKETDRKLLASDTKTLSDREKGTKKTLQQNVGAYLAKIKTHILKAESAEKAKSAENAVSTPEKAESSATKTQAQRVQKMLDDVIKTMQKMEKPNFDVADAIKRINAVKGIVPAL
jgi:uncharacterized protein (DUF885 family)